jgi:hypothetical protein
VLHLLHHPISQCYTCYITLHYSVTPQRYTQRSMTLTLISSSAAHTSARKKGGMSVRASCLMRGCWWGYASSRRQNRIVRRNWATVHTQQLIYLTEVAQQRTQRQVSKCVHVHTWYSTLLSLITSGNLAASWRSSVSTALFVSLEYLAIYVQYS